MLFLLCSTYLLFAQKDVPTEVKYFSGYIVCLRRS